MPLKCHTQLLTLTLFHYEKVLNYPKFSNIENIINDVLMILDSRLLDLTNDIKSYGKRGVKLISKK